MKPLFFSGALFLLFGTSCYYDKYENFKPATICDTTAASTFAANVKPILDAQCNVCHGGTSPSGSVKLDTYDGAKAAAQSGKLIGSLVWDGTALPMPKGAFDKIDACNIQTIKNWIKTNYPQ